MSEFDRDFSAYAPVTVTFTAPEVVALFKQGHPLHRDPDPHAFFSVLTKLDSALALIKTESARRDAA